MRFEPVPSARREPWGVTRAWAEQALGSSDAASPWQVTMWDESLAVSVDSAGLSWLALEGEYGTVLGARAITHAASVPERTNVRFLRDVPRHVGPFNQVRLEADLRRAFEAEPMQDGIVHAAEDVIGDAVSSMHGDEALKCLRSMALDAGAPVLAASVLRCLGRESRVGTADWRSGLIEDALQAASLQMRDAAVQAAETWGDRQAVEVLEAHVESDEWLRDYVVGVIDDLRAEGSGDVRSP